MCEVTVSVAASVANWGWCVCRKRLHVILCLLKTVSFQGQFFAGCMVLNEGEKQNMPVFEMEVCVFLGGGRSVSSHT